MPVVSIAFLLWVRLRPVKELVHETADGDPPAE
jgi:hypothetical protein